MTNTINQDWVDDRIKSSWTTDDYTIVAMDDGYTYDPADTFLIDLASGDRIGAILIPGRSSPSPGVYTCDDFVIPTPAGSVLVGFWIYLDTGDETTSRLTLWVDHNADGTPVSGTTTADGISCPISPSGVFDI